MVADNNAERVLVHVMLGILVVVTAVLGAIGVAGFNTLGEISEQLEVPPSEVREQVVRTQEMLEELQRHVDEIPAKMPRDAAPTD
jgi:hypothetical protein